MAGSWNHMVKKSGKLRSPEHLVEMMGTPGDMIEALEECYGMVQVLADQLATQLASPDPRGLTTNKDALIRWANINYRHGVHLGGSKTRGER